MDKMVFFNVAWMKRYQGLVGDTAVNGGYFVNQYGFGVEMFNFQHFRDNIYGFVEAGWKPVPKCINITKLDARRTDQSVSDILVIWVARQPHREKTAKTLVVGWYENAKVFRERQTPPLGSHRTLPDNKDAPYFAEAQRQDCLLIPDSMRALQILRATEPGVGPYKAGGIGQSNIWYAQDPYGTQMESTKASLRADIIGCY
jgi:hypothetical protein